MGQRRRKLGSAVTEFLAEIGRKGGHARAKSMSEADRKAASKRGGASRWAGLSAEQRKKLMDKVRAKRTYQSKKPKS
jgi:general stress protein YciG